MSEDIDPWAKSLHKKGFPHSDMVPSGSFTYDGDPYYHEEECSALTNICEFEELE